MPRSSKNLRCEKSAPVMKSPARTANVTAKNAKAAGMKFASFNLKICAGPRVVFKDRAERKGPSVGEVLLGSFQPEKLLRSGGRDRERIKAEGVGHVRPIRGTQIGVALQVDGWVSDPGERDVTSRYRADDDAADSASGNQDVVEVMRSSAAHGDEYQAHASHHTAQVARCG